MEPTPRFLRTALLSCQGLGAGGPVCFATAFPAETMLQGSDLERVREAGT